MPLNSALSQWHILCVAHLLLTPWIICLRCVQLNLLTFAFLYHRIHNYKRLSFQGQHFTPMALISCHDWASNLLPPDDRAGTLTNLLHGGLIANLLLQHLRFYRLVPQWFRNKPKQLVCTSSGELLSNPSDPLKLPEFQQVEVFPKFQFFRGLSPVTAGMNEKNNFCLLYTSPSPRD